MKVLLYGGTGMLGSRIMREALHRGHEVTAVLRNRPARIEDGDRLDTVLGDVTDPTSVATLGKGYDAIISAVGARPHAAIYRRAAESLVVAARAIGQPGPRLLAVGGAGSLEVAPGVRLVDTLDFPAAFSDEARAQSEALDYYRTVQDVPWTYVSPAALIEPGERTGRYRVGGDQLLTDDAGNSRISAEDYAVAFVDELENARGIGCRLSIAY